MTPTLPAANLSEFIRVSSELGKDFRLVQAAGGNTSVKAGSTMWVKGSGKWLAHADRTDSFVPVDIEAYRAAIADGVEVPPQDAVIGNSELRPSIETAFHAVLPHKYVLHIHAISILAHAVVDSGKAALSERFADRAWSWIPYVRPGWDLAREVGAAARAEPETRVFVLANHGLIVVGQDLDDTAALLRRIAIAAETPRRLSPGVDKSLVTDWLNRANRRGSALRAALNPIVHSLALDPISYRRCQSGVLYPDQAVFLGPSIHGCGRSARRCNSPYEVQEGVGVFVAEDAAPSVEAMLECHAEVLARIPDAADVCTLAESEVRDLINWDSEAYRRSAGR